MTKEQRFKTHKLMQAVFALTLAKEHIADVLRDTDVGADYAKQLGDLITELEDDITDIQSPAT